MTVEIKNYRAINEGTVKGEFGIFLPKIGLLIRRLRLLENEKGQWLGFPSFSFEKDGQKKWCPFFQFMDPEHDKKLKESILSALEPFLKEKTTDDLHDPF